MLRFGIIGCGAIGERHALQASAAGRLTAVCDIIEDKAARLAQSYGARPYQGLNEMLSAEKDLDVVAVCTPNGLHAEHTIMALLAGCNVVCEKPMALHTADCERMINAAETSQKELFIVKQNRFNPPVMAVKQLLDQYRLGRIYSVQMNGCWQRNNAYYEDSWRGTLDLDGGMLFTQFSHFIDLLYWMIGDVKEARSFKHNYAHQGHIEFEDAVVTSLLFENGTIASLHFTTNSFGKNMEGAMLIVAQNGTVKIGGQYLNTLEYLEMDGEKPVLLSPGNAANDYGAYKGSMSNHDKMYAHVVDVLTKGKPNLFSGREGIGPVAIIEKIYQSMS